MVDLLIELNILQKLLHILYIYIYVVLMFRKQEAAEYLQEFMVWSIKQSGSGHRNINIKSVLNRC